MRTLCMAADAGGPGTGAGGLFGMPNRSLPAISPCSDLTSMADHHPFLGLELKSEIFSHWRELTGAQVRSGLGIANLQKTHKTLHRSSTRSFKRQTHSFTAQANFSKKWKMEISRNEKKSKLLAEMGDKKNGQRKW
jgi:hypothetical protein